MQTVAFTRITASNPLRLTKRFDIAPDGGLKKTSAGHLIEGTAERVGFRDLRELDAHLQGLAPNQAVAWGLTAEPFATIVAERLLSSRPGSIKRGRANFAFSDGPGVMMLDHDESPETIPGGIADPSVLVSLLTMACPALAAAPMLIRPSATAGLFGPRGEPLAPRTRWRIYIPVRSATKIPEAGERLVDLLWANGWGWISISKSARQLPRTLLDAAVWQPERLDFAAAPELGPGITRPLIASMVRGSPAALFDLDRITIADEVKAAAQTARDAAKRESAPAAAEKRAVYADQHAPKLAERSGISIDEARAVLANASERLELGGSFQLITSQGATVTVDDLLADPARFEGCQFHDPLEPNYGNADPRIAIAFLSNARPTIHSHAHGGQIFTLTSSPQRLFSGSPISALLPSPVQTAPAETATEPPLSFDEAQRALLGVRDNDALQRQWMGIVRRAPPECSAPLLEIVAYRLGTGVRALSRALSDARQHQRREAKRAEIQAHVGGRLMIEHRPDASAEQAAQVESAILKAARPGEYVSFSGVLSQVTVKPLPFTHLIDDARNPAPPVPQIEPLTDVAVVERIEGVAKFYETLRDGTPKLIAVPDRLVKMILGRDTDQAPKVSGLLAHPLVLPCGAILNAPGLHAETGLFLAGAALSGVRPFQQSEAAAALQRLRSGFLEGFEFASDLDADVSVAALITGVQRRVLDSAPGLAILANTQSSGKTTLARRLHAVLTGRDMPVSTFALGNEAEVAKAMLAMLLHSPAMVCFDNVPDGFTFHSGTLAAVMTSSTFAQRVLGVSKNASAPTNVLIVLTGNNLSFGNDEVTRWLVCRLSPKTARPHERTFRHPDVVGHALSIRAGVLADVVGIVAGYLQGGAPTCAAGIGTRFPAWDRFVRQPLAWAGGADVAAVFRSNADESEPMRAHRSLLWALSTLFGEREFTAANVAAPLAPFDSQVRETLRAAIEALRAKSDSARSVGHALASLEGKTADVEGREMRLVRAINTARNMGAYRVAVG